MADSPIPITGVVQHYAWGDLTFIPELLHTTADGRPWAELWLGTHPNGPTRLADGSPLSELTGDLPYLLKVLAAGEPLSLQTHPNAVQAADGYARGVLPDPNPKPELLCALTPFQALSAGTRSAAECLGQSDEFGTVTVGKRADLLLLDGDPLLDVNSANEPIGAMVRGRWLDRAALDGLLSELRPTPTTDASED